MKKTKATIALSMIVKNESHIVVEALKTIYTLLDYYIVVDTGSSDGTQDIIKKFFDEKNIPGEIISHKWKNYGDARNVALQHTIGKADYGFWIDADDKLEIDDDFNVDEFKEELFINKYDGLYVNYLNFYNFIRTSFFSTTEPWKWYGALHELLICDKKDFKVTVAKGLRIVQYSCGSSWSNPNKWIDYLDMILDFMKTTDKNHELYPRWIFFLAQTYNEAGYPEKALEYYDQRSKMENNMDDERYLSLFRIARIKESLGRSQIEINDAFLKCTPENLNRVDHLIPIIRYYNSIEQYSIAYIYSSYAMKFAGKYPENSVLYYKGIYDWEIYDLHNISSWWSGRIDEAKETFKLLWKQVEKGLVPESEIERITYNKQFNM